MREPPPRSGNQQSAGGRGQISGWKARSTFICVHSCPFVSIRGSKSPLRFLRVFASSREAHVARTPSSQRQSAVSRWQRTDLGLESPIYIHLWPFVSIRVHSWFKITPAFPDSADCFPHAKPRREIWSAAIGSGLRISCPIAVAGCDGMVPEDAAAEPMSDTGPGSDKNSRARQ